MASKKKAKAQNARASGGFVIAAIIAVLVLGGGVKCEPSKHTPPPPSVPTDVGTLKP